MTLVTCQGCGRYVSDESGACIYCGCPFARARVEAPAPETPLPATAELLAVAPSKLILLSLCTFGLYIVYWAWRNWRWVKEAGREDVTPSLRAWFTPFFLYSLLEHIEGEAAAQEIPAGWSDWVLALGFFLLSASWRLPDPYWLMGYLTFLPLLLPQRTINALHAQRHGRPVTASYSAGEIALLVAGGLWFALVLLGQLTQQRT